VHEWEVRALKESAQVMVQSERDEEQKYIDCALGMMQSERDEEQKYIECALGMMQPERDEEQKYIECTLGSLSVMKSRKKRSHVYLRWLFVSRHNADTTAGYESLCGHVCVTSVMFCSEIIGTMVV
jgi:hypothetical protein